MLFVELCCPVQTSHILWLGFEMMITKDENDRMRRALELKSKLLASQARIVELKVLIEVYWWETFDLGHFKEERRRLTVLSDFYMIMVDILMYLCDDHWNHLDDVTIGEGPIWKDTPVLANLLTAIVEGMNHASRMGTKILPPELIAKISLCVVEFEEVVNRDYDFSKDLLRSNREKSHDLLIKMAIATKAQYVGKAMLQVLCACA